MSLEKKIHIVHIIPTLDFGGAERFVIDLVNNLDSKLFRSTIILFSKHAPLRSSITNKDVDVRIIEKKGTLSFHLFSDIKQELQTLKPDVVHTNLFGGDVWGRIAAQRMNIPIVTTEHNINVGEGMIKHKVKKMLRTYSNIYTCPSKAVKTYMQSAYAINKHIHVIRYGIELKTFTSLSLPRFHKPFRLLIIGRLVEQKGHITALHALSQLKQYDWTLDIVGDGESRQSIKRMVTALELQDRVTMYPATSNTAKVYSKSDVVLVPSHWEGLGIVVMEAMAAGRLVVGTKTGGIPEMIDHKKNGVLVDPKSAQSLVKGLAWCFDHIKACAVLAKVARGKATHEFGVDEMTVAYEKIYTSLVT